MLREKRPFLNFNKYATVLNCANSCKKVHHVESVINWLNDLHEDGQLSTFEATSIIATLRSKLKLIRKEMKGAKKC